MTTATLPTLDTLLAKLDDLALLQFDWDGYQGYPPTPEALLAAKQLLLHLHDFNPAYLPHDVVPLSDGAVELEWINRDATRQLYLEASIAGNYLAFLIDETSGTRHTRSWVHALYRDLHHAIQVFLA